MHIKPGEIYMNDDEIKNGDFILSDADEQALRGSHKTGMDE